MSYFDDNEDRIIYGGRRHGKRRLAEKFSRAALAAPAGSELAQARTAAHQAFDPLWKSGLCSRGVAYEWLATELRIPVTECHMVLFDVAMCQRVVAICEAHPHVQRAKVAMVADEFDDLTEGDAND